MTTACTVYCAPMRVVKTQLPPSWYRSTISACLSCKFGCNSSLCFITLLYSRRSICARRECTAGPLALVQHAALQKSRVRRAPHLAAERVDLAHQMALRRAADRRVARAVSHRIHIDGEYHRLTAEARPRASAASMPACPAPITATVICSGLIGQIGFPLYRFPKDFGHNPAAEAPRCTLFVFQQLFFQRPSFQKQPLSPANATESPLFLHSL